MSDPKPQPIVPATAETAPEARFEWSQSPFETFLENNQRDTVFDDIQVHPDDFKFTEKIANVFDNNCSWII
jgi:hypothetical protein